MKAEPLLEISGDSGIFADYKELKQALKAFCETLDIDKNSWVSLIFCSSAEMQEINRKYRGVDKTTDVLSFPSQQKPSQFSPEDEDKQFLGEILIDINYILGQTESVNLSMAVIEVFIHGLLHLVGHDHINSQQKEKMQEMEKSIMNIVKQEGISGK